MSPSTHQPDDLHRLLLTTDSPVRSSFPAMASDLFNLLYYVPSIHYRTTDVELFLLPFPTPTPVFSSHVLYNNCFSLLERISSLLMSLCLSVPVCMSICLSVCLSLCLFPNSSEPSSPDSTPQLQSGRIEKWELF